MLLNENVIVFFQSNSNGFNRFIKNVASKTSLFSQQAANGAVAAVLWMRPSGRRRDRNSHRPSALRSGVWQGWFDIGSGSPISGEPKGKAQHRQARDISVPKLPQLCQKDCGQNVCQIRNLQHLR